MKNDKKIKLLIVDDSVLFRSQIQLALKECPFIDIFGAASNGKIALEKLQHSQVDVCILDIEMPVMTGIETLKEIMARKISTKVIMFSSQSQAGADKTLEAMKLGAVDFVPKPLPDGSDLTPAEKIREALLPKILSLFNIKETESSRPLTKSNFHWELFSPEVLVVASSTGGPHALIDFFSRVGARIHLPILVAQHMPPLFTASLARQIEQVSGRACREAIQGESLRSDITYIAPGDYHMRLSGERSSPVILLDQEDRRNYVRPCADFLFESAAEIYGPHILGIVMTGMGRDGADGAGRIKEKGGAVLIQDKESSVVFGMPGAVCEAGTFDFMGNPGELAEKTLLISKRRKSNVA